MAKIIELTEAQYHHYAAHLGEIAPFIKSNRDRMGTDGVSRCLLVTARNRQDGILVDTQGYPFQPLKGM